MNAPELLRRMAELSEEEALARLISGARVRVGTTWLSVGERRGSIVLLDDRGQDVEYSNLDLIEEVRWPSRGVTQAVSASVERGGSGS